MPDLSGYEYDLPERMTEKQLDLVRNAIEGMIRAKMFEDAQKVDNAILAMIATDSLRMSGSWLDMQRYSVELIDFREIKQP